MKKYLLALVGLGSLGAFAEGAAATDAITEIGGKLATQMTTWQNSIVAFFSDNSTAIFGILGVVLAFSLVWVGLRLFTKATRKAG